MNKKLKRLLKKINLMMVKISGRTPPKEIPADMLDKYTLNGRIGVKKWYFNEVRFAFTPRIYTRKKINLFFELEKNKKRSATETEAWLYKAIKKYPIKDKSVVNIGAGGPYYECIFLTFGAKETTTIEYNKLMYFHPKMKTMTPNEYDKNPIKFDAGFSISSFEHDGLGRYGDSLNPEADLMIMKKMKSIIKPGGLLFLAVPVGKDLIVWNAHRVYGRIRLPLLLKDWKVLDIFEFDKKKLNMDNKEGTRYQPVFVLKNNSK